MCLQVTVNENDTLSKQYQDEHVDTFSDNAKEKYTLNKQEKINANSDEEAQLAES